MKDVTEITQSKAWYYGQSKHKTLSVLNKQMAMQLSRHRSKGAFWIT